jgi:hypothetical protein
MHRYLQVLVSTTFKSNDREPYLSKQRCQRPCTGVIDRLMATETSAWVDLYCTIVGTRLADVVVGDGPNLGAILIAVRVERSGTATQLTGGSAVGEGEEKGCDDEYGMLHV